MWSSSSECDCKNFLNSFIKESYTSTKPIYPALGQPLIYYAQVQHPLKRKRSNSNRFAKAFRWYTQDHGSIKNKRTNNKSDNTEEQGFATWLDGKYNEYLMDSQKARFVIKQTSTINISEAPYNDVPYEPLPAKKVKRPKSPWKKRCKLFNAEEKGDAGIKSNHSVEIILKPKPMCPMSECCQGNKTGQCCNWPNAVSSSKENTEKIMRKSRSLMSILREREIYVVPFDCSEDVLHNEPRNTRNKKSTENASLKKIRQHRDVSCQCSQVNTRKTDAYSQYDTSSTSRDKSLHLCCCRESTSAVKSPKYTTSREPKAFAMPKVKPDKQDKPEQTTRGLIIISRPIGVETSTHQPLLPINESVQTSDNPLNIGKQFKRDIHVKNLIKLGPLAQDIGLKNKISAKECPFYMKIVCADKLNEFGK